MAQIIKIPEYQQLSDMMTQLLTYYTDLARTYNDMFYNPDPKDIEVPIFDENGQISTRTVPNRAKDMRFTQYGAGEPEGRFSATIGTTYQDTTNGNLYIKKYGQGNTGWFLVSADQSVKEGYSSPEGFITGSKGELYKDITSCNLYIKTTETGNLGWRTISANTTTLADRDLSNLTASGESHFDTRYAKVDLSNLNEEGRTYLNTNYANVSLDNLNTDGEARFSAKANISLDNLSETGEAHFDNKYASKNLSSLGEDGENRLHALKSYEDKGELLTDEEGLTAVKAYKASGSAVDPVTNKPYIDIVKPNDYNIAGSPTISADGIAEGFTSNNYIYSEINFNLSETGIFEVELGDIHDIIGEVTTEQYIIQIYRSDVTEKKDEIVFRRGSLGDAGLNPDWALRIFNDSPQKEHVVFGQGVSENINDIDTLKFGYDGTKYYFQADRFTAPSDDTNEKLHAGTYKVYIGVRYEPDGPVRPLVNGRLDLNRIRISVDNEVIYQPCLRIPYTLSKTGSMIVDSKYRDRVSDVYEEYGSAPYYTLDEVNNNFTLPQGEVYGLSRVSNQITTIAPAIKAYGVSKVGDNIVEEDGVVSGFTTANYVAPVVEFTTEDGDWEINLKFTTGSDVSSSQAILAGNSALAGSPGQSGLPCGSVEIWLIRGTLKLILSSDGVGNGNIVSYPGGTPGTNVTETYTPTSHYVLSAETTYWVRARFTKETRIYQLEYSLNGRTYTLDREYKDGDTNREVLPSCFLMLGLDNTSSAAFLGSIDLKGCNFIAGDTIMWQGALSKENVYVAPQKPAVIVETYSNGNSWYRIWSDGWCEQGGTAPVNTTMQGIAEQKISVELLKPYTTSNYTVTSNIQADGISNFIYYDVVSFVYKKNTSSVVFGISPTNDNHMYIPYIYWETKGYIK